MKKIKDYIYLDEVILNSTLAQFEKGLVKSVTSELGSEETVEKSESDGYSTGLEGIFSIGINAIRNGNSVISQNNSEFQKEIINSIVHDHAVDLLINKCIENDYLVKSSEISLEGDFVLLESNFNIYDFKYIEDITTDYNLEFYILANKQEELLNTKKELQKIKKANMSSEQKLKLRDVEQQIKDAEDSFKKSHDIFSQICLMSRFCKAMFHDSIIIKLDNSIAICKNDMFRMNRSQLPMLNDSSRKLTFFGIIISEKKEIHKDGKFDELNPNEMNKIPSMLSEIVLSTFNIIKSGDKFIKPIAIYFE